MFAANSPNQVHPSTADGPAWGITEVVLPNRQSYDLLMPTLAYLSRSARDRWFTWIAPPGVTKKLLLEFGFDTKRVRLVHTASATQAFYACRQALSNGNSNSVIAALDRPTSSNLDELERAAVSGCCSGLLLRFR